MLRRSPMDSSASGSSCTCFSTVTDSPVRADSSTVRLAARSRRPSAGTRSPARRRTMSPGTSALAGTTVSRPSRNALAVGAAILRKAASARSARYSWAKPSSTAKNTMIEMTTASSVWPRNPETTVAPSRIRINAFLNCAKNVPQAELVRSACSSLGPHCSSRCWTSTPVSPEARVSRAFITASGVAVCHAFGRSPSPSPCWSTVGAQASPGGFGGGCATAGPVTPTRQERPRGCVERVVLRESR